MDVFTVTKNDEPRAVSKSQSVLVSSVLSLILATFFVMATSTTIPPLPMNAVRTILEQPLLTTIITLHGVITDITFIFLISFLILCNHDPAARWIARNQSFPYSYSPSWNFGPRSLDFQLLIFEIFHIGWAARTIHMVGIVLEEGLWAMIVYLTFGDYGLLVLMVTLTVQCILYQDVLIGTGIAVANTLVLGGVWCLVKSVLIQSWDVENVAVSCIFKGLLFWTVTIRTISHVLEPLPPTYRPEVECFDNNFGVVGWKLCLSDVPRAVWLVILGNVSEFGAGMPGRLFNVVVYKCMYKCGYRSYSGLLDVHESKIQARKVIECGWMAHPETAKMYDWALAGRIGCLKEQQEQERERHIEKREPGCLLDEKHSSIAALQLA